MDELGGGVRLVRRTMHRGAEGAYFGGGLVEEHVGRLLAVGVRCVGGCASVASDAASVEDVVWCCRRLRCDVLLFTFAG